jgi:predicted amidophosphoribosyltransferase
MPALSLKMTLPDFALVPEQFDLDEPEICAGCGDDIYNDEQGAPFWWSDGYSCSREFACHPCVKENKKIGGSES